MDYSDIRGEDRVEAQHDRQARIVPAGIDVTETTGSLFDRGFKLLLRHLGLFLLLTSLGAATALALSYLFTPVFKADVTLVPSDEMLGLDQNSLLGGFSGIASLVGAGGGGLGNKENEAIAILKSRGLIWSYMADNNLLPVLFPKKWNSQTRKWKSDSKDYVPTLEDGYRLFDRDIRNVIDNRKNSIVTLSITWRDPKVAKQWADGLVDAANDLLRRQEIERSTKNLQYLQGASEKTSVMEVRNSIYKLMESEIKKQMIALGNKDYAFRVVDPAVVPERKSFPKHSYFAVFGGAVGAMAWFLVISIRNRDPERPNRR